MRVVPEPDRTRRTQRAAARSVPAPTARRFLPRSAHPLPGDVLLLVEVAETTLAYDRDIKLPLYARAGIPEVWIVDLATPMLQIHRAPSGDRYADRLDLPEPGTVTLAALLEVSIDLTGLFA